MKVHNQDTMKTVHGFQKAILVLLLISAVMTGLFLGCGKLSDDTNRPSSPIGRTEGLPFPIAPSASLGSYTLSISADSSTIPADGINFTVLHAKLADNSGRSLSGYRIVFQADSNGFFSTTTGNIGLTDSSGEVSVRLLGRQSGSCVVEAGIYLSGGASADLIARTTVVFTPGGIPNSAGTYSLQVIALPNTVPADQVTYSTIIAMLRDSSGGSVENFTMEFTTEVAGSYGLGYLSNSPISVGTDVSVQGTTTALGDSSVYFYGARAGSALVQACVTIADLDSSQLCETVWITITEGPGDLGDDIQGILFTTSPSTQTVQADDTGLGTPEEITLNVQVWDETGDPAGPGVRVEFTGAIGGYGETDGTGLVTTTFNPGQLSIGDHSYDITACTIIRGTEYCETDTVSVTVLPPDPAELTITLTASPEEIEVSRQTTLRAIVAYENQLLSNVTVAFQTSLGLFGSSTSTTAVTDEFGIATTTLSAGTTPGTATVYALANTDLPSGGSASGNVSTEVSIIASPAAIQVYCNGGGSADDYDSAADHTTTFILTTLVTDSIGQRVEGIEVLTTLLLQNDECQKVEFETFSGSGTTDASGRAEISYSITGIVPTNSPHCVFNVEAVAGSGSSKVVVNHTASDCVFAVY